MKTGRSLQDLAAELDRQAKSKRDFIADSRRLSLVPAKSGPEPVVLEGINGGLPLRSTAHGQLAATLGIPKTYYDRCLAEAPDLLCKNVNRWLHGEVVVEGTPKPAERRLIRTLDGRVRAILSDSYRPLDNVDLAEAVLPKLTDLETQVVSAEVTDSRFYLKAVTARITGEVKKGDWVQAGVVVSNSEVGQGSLRVEALDYWLLCLNGMVREQAIRKAHLGRSLRGADALEDAREYFRTETRMADDRAFFLKVQDATAAMFDQIRFNTRMDQYRDAAERKIPTTADPVKVIEITAKTLGLTDSERGGMLQHLIRGGDMSAYGLANSLTRMSQDVESYDRASELEALGARIIELPKQQWANLVKVNAEVSA